MLRSVRPSVSIFTMRNYTRGFVTVAELAIAGAIGLGGLGAAVSFYQSNEKFSAFDGTVHVSTPAPTPTPTVQFYPVVTDRKP